MRGLGRYLLFQLPGWIAVALIMGVWQLAGGLSSRIAWTVWIVWVVKDLVLFPFLRRAYDLGERRSPEEQLVGEEGVAEQDLEPLGYVRVRAELWRARAEGAPAIRRGERVRVRAVDGMILIVIPVAGGPEFMAPPAG